MTPTKPQQIKAIRAALKLTQVDLGRLLGVSGNTVARWERGLMTPPGNLLDLALRTVEAEERGRAAKKISDSP